MRERTECWCGSMAEQLICNQQVDGSTPFTSSKNMGDFPSGQRGQTVNLLSLTSVVRIHHPPPTKPDAIASGFCFGGGWWQEVTDASVRLPFGFKLVIATLVLCGATSRSETRAAKMWSRIHHPKRIFYRKSGGRFVLAGDGGKRPPMQVSGCPSVSNS